MLGKSGLYIYIYERFFQPAFPGTYHIDMPKITALDEMQLGNTRGISFQETMEKILLSSESIHSSYDDSLPIQF